MARSLIYASSIATVLIIVTLNAAADPDRCCWSPQWEGYYDEVYGLFVRSTNYSSLTERHTNVHQDSYKRMVVLESLILSTEPFEYVTQYLDYGKHVVYLIKGGTCQTIPYPNFAMPDHCLPENSNYVGSRIITGVTGDMWLASSNNGTFNVTTSRTIVSPENCIPLQFEELLIGDLSSFSIITTQNYTAGIANPSVFNIPAICNQSAVHTIPSGKLFRSASGIVSYL